MKVCNENCKICAIPKQAKDSWMQTLNNEFEKDYFQSIIDHLHRTTFFPPVHKVLRCLTFFDVKDTKVVILGQDPYHGPGQADGLAFSVPLGINLPPSLQNIKKEILSSCGKKSICTHGCLDKWAEQGVLLLNATLTVLNGQANSHSNLGWQIFTDAVIDIINREADNVVFMLWGKFAQKKSDKINKDKHLVLASTHPSPFSVNLGFYGCNHFKLANDYLEKHGKETINW